MKKYILLTIGIAILVSLSGCINLLPDNDNNKSSLSIRLEIDNYSGDRFTLYLPIPIRSHYMYGNHTELEPIYELSDLRILEDKDAEMEIVSLNSTYFLEVISQEEFLVIELDDKFNRGDVFVYSFSNLSSDEMYSSHNESLIVDYFVFYHYDDLTREWYLPMYESKGGWEEIPFEIDTIG